MDVPIEKRHPRWPHLDISVDQLLAAHAEYGTDTLLLDYQNRIAELEAALLKLRSYNEDTHKGRMNYRPLDHIFVIDKALNSGS